MDLAGLYVGITGNSTVTIYDSVGTPAGATLVHQDETYLDWQVDTVSGQEHTFSGRVDLMDPDVSFGLATYTVGAHAHYPSIARVADSVVIFLDPSGNQVDGTAARQTLEVPVILPTAPPDLTIVPFTPFPTLVPPAPTPVPATTVPGYPGPVPTSPTPAVEVTQAESTATLP
jgi:hypothetical protein